MSVIILFSIHFYLFFSSTMISIERHTFHAVIPCLVRLQKILNVWIKKSNLGTRIYLMALFVNEIDDRRGPQHRWDSF